MSAVDETVRRIHDDLADVICDFVADLKIIARDQRLHALAAGDQNALQPTSIFFETVASQKPRIAQLRYIDSTGREVVRVNRNQNDTLVIPRDQLQDKSNRYYFKEAINLPLDTVYVSAIDLNVEHGAIEQPWRPMLRLAMPIQPAGPKSRGIVVININAATLLKQVETSNAAENRAILQLLNEEGYWLAGVPEDQLWGFMFGNQTSMAQDRPDVWKEIMARDQGRFHWNAKEYVFQTLRPSRFMMDFNNGTTICANDAFWKIVAEVPRLTLIGLWHPHHIPIAVSSVIAIAMICYKWSQATIRRNQAEANKKRAEQKLFENERFASLGTLVAGISHELSTPIGNAVMVASKLAQSTKRLDSGIETGRIKRSSLEDFNNEMREGTAILLRSLERAGEIITSFKKVAIDQTSEQRRSFSLSELVNEVFRNLQHQFKNTNIQLLSTDIPDIILDSFPGPLGQAMMNIIVNAKLHAFDEDTSGQIIVSAKEIDDGNKVEITIRDTGVGIPRNRLIHIFEPFYTTRLGRGGSGLGLSVVYNIVTATLGGKVHAKSTVGLGTSLVIRIPVKAPENPDKSIESRYNVNTREDS